MPMNRFFATASTTVFASAAILAAPLTAGRQGNSAHQVGAGQEADHAPGRAPHRSTDDPTDRHLAEQMTFFQVEPGMKVGVYSPDHDITPQPLAKYLARMGQYVGLFYSPSKGRSYEEAEQDMRQGAAYFPESAAGWTGLPKERFAGLAMVNIPKDQNGTFDRILVIRMVDFLANWDAADSQFAAMRELLKPDGMIGIVQHRARADAPYSYANGCKGYMRQDDVIAYMHLSGFELVGASEMGANPKDTADHPNGIDAMPSVIHTRRELTENKGQTDQMTLLFRKRP